MLLTEARPCFEDDAVTVVTAVSQPTAAAPAVCVHAPDDNDATAAVDCVADDADTVV
jgi:hypothetical protein